MNSAHEITPTTPLALLDSDPAQSQRSLRTILVDQAYQDFCARRDQGEDLNPDDYCAQNPEIKSSLGRLLQMHAFLQENSILLDVPTDHEWPLAGDTFLDFELLQVLGAGAFARVYLAREVKLNRLVALKLSQRAEREVQILGQINHKNIVAVHSIQKDKVTRLSAVCMPYLGSVTLHGVLDRVQAQLQLPTDANSILEVVQDVSMPLDSSAPPACVDPILQDGTFVDGVRLIGAQLAEALAYLHARGIYHRDMKPSNVLMRPDGTPMLLDFNLSTEDSGESVSFRGTLQYMAPELLNSVGHDAVGAPADLYSLGVILYQLLTGKHPFGPLPLDLKEDPLRELLMQRQTRAAAPVREINPHVEPALSELIGRLLAPNAKSRPQSAAAVAKLLAPRRPTPGLRKSWLVRAALLCFVLAAGAVGTALYFTGGNRDLLPAANAAYREGRYHESIEFCNAILVSDPENVQTLFQRARANQKLAATQGSHHYNAARADYRAADEKSPSGEFKAGIGYCLGHLDQHSAAAAMYQAAIKADFANAEVHNNLGYALLKLRNIPEAQLNLDEALRLKKGLATVHHNRALAVLLHAQTKQNLLEPRATKGFDPQGNANPRLKELYQTLQGGIQDIESSLQLGEISSEAHFDAARICALAARLNPEYTQPALKHLKEALERGHHANSVNDVLFRPLRTPENARAFIELEQIRSTVKDPPKARHLLDPIHD